MTKRSRTRMRRRVAVVTGTRAEYGLLRSTMEAVDRHPRLTLQVVVTGMHLIRCFGYTVREIQKDGWTIDARIPMQRGDDDPLDQATGLSRGVAGIARFLKEAKTEVVVVLGDRIEALAAALAGVSTGRFVAHVHAGDVAPGDFDNSIRHAISKLAHLHLTATEAARQRVITMGEHPQRVHWVGAPGLDQIVTLARALRHASLHERKKRAESEVRSPTIEDRMRGRQTASFRSSDFALRSSCHGFSGGALVIQHPCGRTPLHERRVMSALLRAVKEAGLARTIVYPNTDRGHSGIIEAIDAHRRACENGEVEVVRSMEREVYLRRLAESAVLIGNSSSGIIEAPSLGTPVVNVGDRQQGRERAADCVVDARESCSSIRAALRRALRARPIIGGKTAYGDGRAGERIARLLASMPLSDTFRRKM